MRKLKKKKPRAFPKHNKKQKKNEYPHVNDSFAKTSTPLQDNCMQYCQTWLCMFEEIKKT